MALKGMNVTLRCSAGSSSDTPMYTAWRKDSEVLYDCKVETFARYHKYGVELIEYTTTLHLFNVNFTDEGKYQCVITNQFGSNYSSKAKLTVNGMYVFLTLTTNKSISEGTVCAKTVLCIKQVVNLSP